MVAANCCLEFVFGIPEYFYEGEQMIFVVEFKQLTLFVVGNLQRFGMNYNELGQV